MKKVSLFFLSLLLLQPYRTYSMEITHPEECQTMCQTIVGGVVVAAFTTGYVANKVIDWYQNRNRIMMETERMRLASMEAIKKQNEYILNPTDIIQQGLAFKKQLSEELPAKLAPYIQIPTDVEIYNDLLAKASENINFLLFTNAPENRSMSDAGDFYIFYGPSYAGKKTTAEAIAYKLNRPIFFLKGSTINDAYQNSGAQRITKRLTPILNSPHDWVVVIDELDIFVAGSNTKEVTNLQALRAAGALCQIVDELSHHNNILLIGICTDTNQLYANLVDRAQGSFISFDGLSTDHKLNLFLNKLTKQAHCPINTNCYDDSFKLMVQTKLKNFPNETIKEMITELCFDAIFYEYKEITQEIILSILSEYEKILIPYTKPKIENGQLYKARMRYK